MKHSWVMQWAVVSAVLSVAITLVVVSPGFDAQKIEREDASLWVTRAGGQYARVNAQTAEIDTVRKADAPSGVLQTDTGAVLLTQGYGRAWVIDPAQPQDFVAQGENTVAAAEPVRSASDRGSSPELTARRAATVSATASTGQTVSVATPVGTRDVQVAAPWILFVTESGEAFVADLENGVLGTPTLIEAFESERVSAAALDARGAVVLVSATSGKIRWYDATRRSFRHAAEALPDWKSSAPALPLQLSIVSGNWVLFDPNQKRVWREDTAPVSVAVHGHGKLQRSTEPVTQTAGSQTKLTHEVLLADEAGVWNVGKERAERIATASGVPTAPALIAANGQSPETVVGWLSSNSAQLWNARTGLIDLALDPTIEMGTDPVPVLHSNGSHAVLADAQTGMMWTAPAGVLMPVAQWSLGEPPQHPMPDSVRQQANDPEPPVAVDDDFGVRPGTHTVLPILLNDHDPNPGDVLTVSAESIGAGIDESFGVVAVLPNTQELTVQVAPEARGSATFSYQISDGGHTSASATVTLRSITETVNTAPVWCGVNGCQRSWPTPEILPGGTLVMSMLDAWVDPEGDPLFVHSAHAIDPAAPLRAVVTSDGRLAVKHTDPHAPDHDETVRVTVSDSHGATTTRELLVAIRSEATPTVLNDALTIAVGHTVELLPLSRVSGGSGNYELVAAVNDNGGAQVRIHAATHSLSVNASETGESTVSITIRDRETNVEITGTVRVTAVADAPPVVVPPLRAFVSPTSDTTVDVLAAIPGADDYGVTVSSARSTTSSVHADVSDHAKVRVVYTGGAITNTPENLTEDFVSASVTGALGYVDVTVQAEQGEKSTGRLTVFAAPEQLTDGVIAMSDAVTVRAGSVTELAVLDNDIAPPGEQLVLDPDIRFSATTQSVSSSERTSALAFASGSVLRVLAPHTPGEYTLTYSSYGASAPERFDTASVRVTVIGVGVQTTPQPPPLTVRIAAGEHARVTVPLSGVDADGDRVLVSSVRTSGTKGLSASIVGQGDQIQVSAAVNVQPGSQTLHYTVTDSQGFEAEAPLRVIVATTPAETGAPVALRDVVRIPFGQNTVATVRPTDNDSDPAGGALELVSVTPQLPGGTAHPNYVMLSELLDVSDLDAGIIRVHAGATLGTVSYLYTVRSTVSKGTSEGSITVHITEHVGAVAPIIRDTVLTAGQRNEIESGGVDVLTDRVTWPGTHLADLQLSVWGTAHPNYSVHGSRIIGPYVTGGATIPFVVRGTANDGAVIESYGFFVIPRFDDLRVTLQPGLEPLTVTEKDTRAIPLTQLLAVEVGEPLEASPGTLAVHRTHAQCAVVDTPDGASLSYSAGRDAPWEDTCTLQVKLAQQSRYSTVVVPVIIIPDQATAQLTALTRAIAPGATETIELTDMLSWYGNRAGDIDALSWSVETAVSGFEIARSGTRLTVTVNAATTPGTQRTLPIRVRGAGESVAALTLRVGMSASDGPRGAVIALRCTVGNVCETDLVGQPGEYDPFAAQTGGGLTVVSVNDEHCRFAQIREIGNRVRVVWEGERDQGGQCVVTFTVRDAQHRTGVGRIELDAQGVPPAPDSVAQTGYTSDTVSLFVAHSTTAHTHLAVTGVLIEMDGHSTSARCTEHTGGHSCLVTGLTAGEAHRFSARVMNTVGRSAATVNAVTAWAYQVPEQPVVVASQVSAETINSATVEFDVHTTDPSTGAYRVSVGGQTHLFQLGDPIVITGIAVGVTNWTVVPLSQFQVPTGDTNAGAGATGTLQVAGLPEIHLELQSEPGNDTVHATVTMNANGGREPFVGVSESGTAEAAACTATLPGSTHTVLLTGTPHRSLHVVGCAATEWGSVVSITEHILVGGALPAPEVQRGFEIALTPTGPSGGTYEYALATAPTVTAAAGAQLEYQLNGVIIGARLPPQFDPEQRIEMQVRQIGAESASEWVTVPGNLPATVRVRVPPCLTPATTELSLREQISLPARSSAAVLVGENLLSITWSGEYTALAPLVVPIPACAMRSP